MTPGFFSILSALVMTVSANAAEYPYAELVQRLNATTVKFEPKMVPKAGLSCLSFDKTDTVGSQDTLSFIEVKTPGNGPLFPPKSLGFVPNHALNLGSSATADYKDNFSVQQIGNKFRYENTSKNRVANYGTDGTYIYFQFVDNDHFCESDEDGTYCWDDKYDEAGYCWKN
jgi:hypothetical protein